MRQAAHPSKPDKPLRGGPQMVEVSRDGKRVYFTNSLYVAWDEQFYPSGVGNWMVKLDVAEQGVESALTRDFSWNLTTTGFIRCGLKAATRPPIRSAIREGSVAVAGAGRTGCFPRH